MPYLLMELTFRGKKAAPGSRVLWIVPNPRAPLSARASRDAWGRGSFTLCAVILTFEINFNRKLRPFKERLDQV